MFAEWGWRIPFLVSLILLVFSVYIRLKLSETPVFLKMREEGKGSKSPLTDSFLRYPNNKYVALALIGATAGQGVVWYTGQFYALFFLLITLKVDFITTYTLIAISLLIGTPFFVFFGWLSDRIGRLKIILAGCAIAALTYFPLFGALTHYANPQLEAALQAAPVVVVADPNACQFQFNPTGTKRFTSSCDIAKQKLVAASVNFRTEPAPLGAVALVRVGDRVLASFDAAKLSPQDAQVQDAAFTRALTEAVRAAGYPAQADPAQKQRAAPWPGQRRKKLLEPDQRPQAEQREARNKRPPARRRSDERQQEHRTAGGEEQRPEQPRQHAEHAQVLEQEQ